MPERLGIVRRIRRFGKNSFRRLPWSWWGPVVRSVSGERIAAGRFKRSNHVGQSCYIDPSVQIFGYDKVWIGNNSAISEDTFVNVNRGRDELLIGNNCYIGRRNYFSTGHSIRIKDFTFTGVDCHFLGCGHEISRPLEPYVTELSEGAPIEVGVNCWITMSVTVLQGVTIGMGSVVGARSVVTRDIPPFSIALGNPAQVVKRFNFRESVWIHASGWHQDLEQALPSEAEYIERLAASQRAVPSPLHASGSRFGWIDRSKRYSINW